MCSRSWRASGSKSLRPLLNHYVVSRGAPPGEPRLRPASHHTLASAGRSALAAASCSRDNELPPPSPPQQLTSASMWPGIDALKTGTDVARHLGRMDTLSINAPVAGAWAQPAGSQQRARSRYDAWTRTVPECGSLLLCLRRQGRRQDVVGARAARQDLVAVTCMHKSIAWTFTLIVIAATGTLTTLVESPAARQPQEPPRRPVFVDGQAQIVPAFQDAAQWIRQTLWVETEFDSDGDGKRDRVFVDVTRPRQTDTEGLEGAGHLRVVAVLRRHVRQPEVPLGREAGSRRAAAAARFAAGRSRSGATRDNVSTSLVTTWVPRGFAVVHSDAPGTGLSQGCVTVGRDPEQLAPKAVIDWLNGRAKGFATRRRQRGSCRVVVHRQSRHDGHVIQRHHPARRGGDRRHRVLKRSSRSRRTRPTTTTTARTDSSAIPAAGSARTSTSSTTSSTAAIPRAATTATRCIATASSPRPRSRHRATTTTSGASAIC